MNGAMCIFPMCPERWQVYTHSLQKFASRAPKLYKHGEPAQGHIHTKQQPYISEALCVARIFWHAQLEHQHGMSKKGFRHHRTLCEMSLSLSSAESNPWWDSSPAEPTSVPRAAVQRQSKSLISPKHYATLEARAPLPVITSCCAH